MHFFHISCPYTNSAVFLMAISLSDSHAFVCESISVSNDLIGTTDKLPSLRSLPSSRKLLYPYFHQHSPSDNPFIPIHEIYPRLHSSHTALIIGSRLLLCIFICSFLLLSID